MSLKVETEESLKNQTKPIVSNEASNNLATISDNDNKINLINNLKVDFNNDQIKPILVQNNNIINKIEPLELESFNENKTEQNETETSIETENTTNSNTIDTNKSPSLEISHNTTSTEGVSDNDDDESTKSNSSNQSRINDEASEQSE